MSYITDKLLAGETVVFETEINWSAYSQLLAPLVLSVILIFLDVRSLFLTIPLLLGIAGCIYIKIRSSEFIVTNKRVLMKIGVINTESVEIMLTKVETIQVEQSIIDKALKRGTIVIRGTGGTANIYHNIDHPLEFRTKVNEQIDLSNNKTNSI